MLKFLAKLLLLTACLLPLSFAAPVEGSPKKDRHYYESRGEAIWEIQTNDKVIALTFDDGPHPETTPQILKLLRKYDASATFFVVGKKAELYPELIMQQFLEGHEVANHTYSHVYFRKGTPVQTIERELIGAEKIISDITGTKPTLFRPPGGYYPEQLMQTARKNGYTVVMWSWDQDTKDWKLPGVNRIIHKVTNNAHNGDIVLFHDYIDGRSQTVEALKTILPELKKQGYRFVTVSELMRHSSTTPVRAD